MYICVKMRQIVFYTILAAQIFQFNHANNAFYTLVAPGVIGPSPSYIVVIALHEAPKACRIKIGIDGGNFNKSVVVIVKPMSRLMVEFQPNRLQPGNYRLYVIGLDNFKFKNSTNLTYSSNGPVVLIQTDKHTYRPGEVVRFWALFLNASTRPAEIGGDVSMQIIDGAQQVVKFMPKINIIKGVYKDKFQLGIQPALGFWKIIITIESEENNDEMTFEVIKRRIPNFVLKLKTAKDVIVQNKSVINALIKARYTNGMPVSGSGMVMLLPSVQHNSQRNFSVMQRFKFEGKASVSLDISKNSGIIKKFRPIPMKMVAVVEDSLTNIEHSAVAYIKLHRQHYRIEIVQAPETFKPNTKLTYKLAIKTITGKPVTDTEYQATLTIKSPIRNISPIVPSRVSLDKFPPLIIQSDLDERGIATFYATLPKSNRTYYAVTAQYRDIQIGLPSLAKSVNAAKMFAKPIEIIVKTARPELNSQLNIEVHLNLATKYFIYTVVGRGNIIRSKFVFLDGGATSSLINFIITFAMVPRIKFFVFYVSQGILNHEEVSIDIKKDFENFISIETPAKAAPGETVRITTNTTRNSATGIIAVDLSSWQFKYDNAFDADYIFQRLTKYDTHTPPLLGHGRYPGLLSGLVTLTNANYVFSNKSYIINEQLDEDSNNNELSGSVNFKNLDIAKMRSKFTTSWIWDFHKSFSKSYNILMAIPDQLTTWSVTGFSLSPQIGIAVPKKERSIRVLKDFFIESFFPFTARPGEILRLPVLILNRMNVSTRVVVHLDSSDNYFEWIESNGTEVKKTLIILENARIDLFFLIRAKVIGLMPIRLLAVTPESSDAMLYDLPVVADGVPHSKDILVFLNLYDRRAERGNFAVDLPQDFVDGSLYVELTAIGDMLKQSVYKMDNLIVVAAGRPELLMSNFMPTLAIIKYLEAIKRDSLLLRKKVNVYLSYGYKRLLTYRRADGSFSDAGKDDKFGSSWLTACAAFGFQLATKYILVSQTIVLEALQFLASKQQIDGHFIENGTLNTVESRNNLILTAWVLLAFFESKGQLRDSFSNVISKGIEYVENAIEQFIDPYSLAMAAFVLQKAKSRKTDHILEILENFHHFENGQKWWSNSKVYEKISQRVTQWRPNNDVEITSYVFLTLLERQGVNSVLPILKWLVTKRNEQGGFTGTYNNVLGLWALEAFAMKIGTTKSDLKIQYKAYGRSTVSNKFIINQHNSIVKQMHILSRTTRKISYVAKGKGTAWLQLHYKYNLIGLKQPSSFELTSTVENATTIDRLYLNACINYLPLPGAQIITVLQLVIMEILLPSGYVAASEILQQIRKLTWVESVQSISSESKLIVRLREMTAGLLRCITVEAKNKFVVAKQKPVYIYAYDYFNRDRCALVYYSVCNDPCHMCSLNSCRDICVGKCNPIGIYP